MAEVSIKSHTRRGKNGKTIQVRGYTRRVGRKGVRSPKRERSASGEEFQARVKEQESRSKVKESAPKMSAEELAAAQKKAKEWNESFKRVEARRKVLGMSSEAYSRMIMRERMKNGGKNNTPTSHATTVKKPLSTKGTMDILARVEDKIAKFVEKYSGKKYKRQL